MTDVPHVGCGSIVEHAFLLKSDHFLRAPKGYIGPGLYLDKDQDIAIPGDNVNFSALITPVALEDGIPCLAQELRGEGFAPFAGIQVLPHAESITGEVK